MPRFNIEKTETGWIIVNANDEELGWSGSFWCNKEQAARILRFPDQAAAERYAQQLFAGRQQ